MARWAGRRLANFRAIGSTYRTYDIAYSCFSLGLRLLEVLGRVARASVLFDIHLRYCRLTKFSLVDLTRSEKVAGLSYPRLGENPHKLFLEWFCEPIEDLVSPSLVGQGAKHRGSTFPSGREKQPGGTRSF